jgi:hypothetical protein
LKSIVRKRNIEEYVWQKKRAYKEYQDVTVCQKQHPTALRQVSSVEQFYAERQRELEDGGDI